MFQPDASRQQKTRRLGRVQMGAIMALSKAITFIILNVNATFCRTYHGFVEQARLHVFGGLNTLSSSSLEVSVIDTALDFPRIGVVSALSIVQPFSRR